MRGLLKEVAAVTLATGHRYVWRGLKSADYTLHSALERRLIHSNIAVSSTALEVCERRLLRDARNSRLWPDLSNGELLAKLQHAGAATSLLDVTPDPYIGLFFATEPTDESGPCVLMAIHCSGDTREAQVALTHRGPLPDDGSQGSLSTYGNLKAKVASSLKAGDPILWECPYLDDRMRAQRGMFLATTAPSARVSYGSFDLELSSPADEAVKVRRLINGERGQYPRPRLVAFYISANLRRKVARELSDRFGYRTETIYPDAAGFALANDQRRSLDPGTVQEVARTRPVLEGDEF